MDKEQNQKNLGVWHNFFSVGYAEASYEEFRQVARNASNQFLQTIGHSLADGDAITSAHPHLDEWVASQEGQDCLAALVMDIQTHINAVAEYALPAHDIRQILFKDSAEALRFSEMEKPEGYKAAFVIPTFCHDIGRLLEGYFYHDDNPHHKWIPHAQLSFLMLQSILDKPDYAGIPKDLRNHFLYAVLAHSGPNGETYMSRAVQACDRMQLIGPEGFFRSLAYGTCLLNAQIHYPPEESYRDDLPTFGKHISVISELEFFARNMRPNLGEVHKGWQFRNAVENVALLLRMTDQTPDIQNILFDPELKGKQNEDTRKRRITPEVWEAAQAVHAQYSVAGGTTVISVYDVVKKTVDGLQSPIGAVRISHEMELSITDSVLRLAPEERSSLYDAIFMADHLRTVQDEIDCSVLVTARSSPQSFIRKIAEKSLAYANVRAEPAPQAPVNIPAFLLG